MHVDLDVVFLTSPCKLWAHADAHVSKQAAVGLVQDVGGHRMYKGLPLQPNGGVVLMELTRLRESATYLRALAEYKERLGVLGDQNLYAHLSTKHQALFERLPCGWNRQLNTHYRDVFHWRLSCPTCDVLHFNGRAVKYIAERLHRGGRVTCMEVRDLVVNLGPTERQVVGHTVGDTCCGLGTLLRNMQRMEMHTLRVQQKNHSRNNKHVR